MSRIDDIEAKIMELLLTIDGTTQSTGYQYHSTTGTVQIFDERLSISRNTDNKMVNHYISQSEDGIYGSEFSAGQWTFTNECMYKIESKVHNNGENETNAKNAITKKMNELFSDLLFLFGNHYTLNGKVASIQFINATRKYEDVTNNRILSAKLITTWKLIWTQSLANPDLKSCA